VDDEACPLEDPDSVAAAAATAAQSADDSRAVWLGRCLIYFRYSLSTDGRFGLKIWRAI
jgi:hypothetical protein